MTAPTVDLNNKHPDSAFYAEYPYNASTITRSGHEIHINDTPGSESIRVAHTIGTYQEIDSSGNKTSVVVGKNYDYYMDGHADTVDGHRDTKIAGTLNIDIDNSSKETVGSNKYVAIGGDHIVGISGTHFVNVNDDKYETIGGNYVLDIDGDDHENITGDSVKNISGTKTDLINNGWSVTSGGSVEILNMAGTFHVKCKNFLIEAETITLVTPSGTIVIDANITQNTSGNISSNVNGSVSSNVSGNISLNASQIHLNG